MDERYQLIDVRGEGTSGVVYRAFDRLRMSDVAIKFPKSPNTDARRELENEVLLLEHLQHEFIVGLLDAELDSQHPYIVTEYCDRGSLRHWTGRLHWSVVVSILRQVVQGLQCIHDSGAFHRDIKPDNLLLKSTNDNAFVVKIADFGIACVLSRRPSMMNGSKGTRGYIAREVLEGEPFASTADIYSLGIVATELLTGKREPGPLAMTNVPPELCALVSAMTNRCPDHRPTLRALREVLNAVSVRPCVLGVCELEIN